MNKTKKYLQVKNPLKNKALGQKQNKNKAKVGGNVIGQLHVYTYSWGLSLVRFSQRKACL